MENLPSFLSLGKALLILFVGEEEDEIGQRQNQALVEEMRGLVESGGWRMEPYLACWIHLYVHQSGLSIRTSVIHQNVSIHPATWIHPSCIHQNTTVYISIFYSWSLFQWSHSSWYVCPGVIPELDASTPCSGPHPFALWG